MEARTHALVRIEITILDGQGLDLEFYITSGEALSKRVPCYIGTRG